MTTLRGLPLTLARAAWLALALTTLVTVVTFLPVRYGQLLDLCRRDQTSLVQWGLSGSLCAGHLLAFPLLTFLVISVICLFIFWRRSEDWRVLLGTTMALGAGAVLSFLHPLVTLPPAWQPPATLIRAVAAWSLVLTTYLIPDGRFIPRWTRGLALVCGAYILSWVVFPDSALNYYNLKAWPFSFLLLVAWLVSGLAAQAYRYYRVSTSILRQQTKWMVFGWSVATLAAILAYLPPYFSTALQRAGFPRLLFLLCADPAFQVSLLFSTACTSFSILRYRLYEIDLIIRRTLIYGALTAGLAAIYSGSVVLLQSLFRAVTGQVQNEIVTVLSTLGIAALFTPLRRWVQQGIDRRFYRRKYDAARTLAAFSAVVRDEVDLNKLTKRLVEVVEETMQPAYVSLWLKPTTDSRAPTAEGRPYAGTV